MDPMAAESPVCPRARPVSSAPTIVGAIDSIDAGVCGVAPRGLPGGSTPPGARSIEETEVSRPLGEGACPPGPDKGSCFETYTTRGAPPRAGILSDGAGA